MIATKSIVNPSLSDVLLDLKDDIFKSMNCIKIGKIIQFDGTKKTAQIQILFKRVLPDETIQSYPVIVDCPVFTLQGGGAAIMMPIAAGDQCIVLFSDRSIDEWFQNGAEAAPFYARTHDLSDGMALVGVNALTSPLGGYSASELQLFNGLGKVGITGGKITITNGAVTLLTVLDGLLDVMIGATDANNVPLSPATIAALTAYKLTLAGLLY